MTREELKLAVLDALAEIAPEIAAAEVDPHRALRDQFDLDSMDFLNFAIVLHKKLGVSIPETDYARLATLDQCIEYLSRTKSA